MSDSDDGEEELMKLKSYFHFQISKLNQERTAVNEDEMLASKKTVAVLTEVRLNGCRPAPTCAAV